MSNNPYAGAVPLNYRQGTEEQVARSTSFRPGETHKPEYRNQYNDRTILPRNEGCTPLRRYPDGRLDFQFVASHIIDIIHKIKDGGNVTEFEKALLTLTLPKQFGRLVDPKIAQTMTKISTDERLAIAMLLDRHQREELNWNAGMGGGSVPGRGSSRS